LKINSSLVYRDWPQLAINQKLRLIVVGVFRCCRLRYFAFFFAFFDVFGHVFGPFLLCFRYTFEIRV
jgi:hypothetical protein